jgi:autotransporter-associated beta strand protein
VTLGTGLTSSGGTLTKSGAGTLTLTGANTFSGATTVSAGTLQIGSGGTSGSLAGNITNNAAVAFNRSDALTYAGDISGTGSLTKSGAGTLTLTGANTYSGATTVSGGGLKLNGTAANSTFTVSAGLLSGTGTTGALTIANGGTFSPGNSPGTLNAGNTTFAGGGTYLWEINNGTGTAGADPGWDLLSISGTLNITATSANPFNVDLTSLTLGNVAGLAANFDASQDHTYLIAAASGGITGFSADKFNLDLSAFTNSLAGGSWSIAQSGNNLNLEFSAASAIPEPSTYAALAGLAALGLVAWRRRTVTA